MFECKNCRGRHVRRGDYLSHLAQCKGPKLDNPFLPRFGLDGSEEDDSDKDPTWHPFDDQSCAQLSSPLTEEEAQGVPDIEEFLGPNFYEQCHNDFIQPANPASVKKRLFIETDKSPELQNTVEQHEGPSPVEEQQESEFILSENSKSQLSGEKDDAKGSASGDKLKLVQMKLAAWKMEVKMAMKSGKTSRARRMRKKIKRASTDGTISTLMLEMSANSIASISAGDTSLNCEEEDALSAQQEGKPKPAVKERKKNYCKYCDKLIVKFSQHLQTTHKNSDEGKLLLSVKGTKEEQRKKRIELTDGLRKEWNNIFNSKNINSQIVVKRPNVSVQNASSHIICKHCTGVYRRDKLSVHLKKCKQFTTEDTEEERVEAVKLHSTLNVPTEKNITNEFKNEILNGIQFDDIINTAINDPTIMKFASNFHSSRRESSNKSYVIREMRDISRLLMKVKEKLPEINTLKEMFNPAYYDQVVDAALSLAGYDPKTGIVKVPSIAYRLSQPLKDCANLVKSQELASIYEKKNVDRASVTIIEDFLSLIESEWKVRIGRICRKALKLAKVDKEQIIAEEEDIMKLAAYVEGKYRKLCKDLNQNQSKKSYDMLMHYLIVHIMLLVRRRPVDFKLAKVRHFGNVDRQDELIGMTKEDLSAEELEACQKFSIFYVPGKNLEIVPIVLTPLMRQVLETLIANRHNVNITCDTLFIHSGEKLVQPTESLRLVKKQITLKKPTHMTGNGLRHQAATFSRLHSTHPQYQDFLASVLGHSLHVHKKNYQLPVGVLQKIMVCPILHDIMTGKKTQKKTNKKTNDTDFQETDLQECPDLQEADLKQCPDLQETEHFHEIHDNVASTSSHPNYDEQEAENATINNIQQIKQKRKTNQTKDMDFESSSDEDVEWHTPKKKIKWQQDEQEIVLLEFGNQVLEGNPPTLSQVKAFLKKHATLSKTRTVQQVHLFLRNHALRNQKGVSPKIKKILEKFGKK